MGRPAQNAAPKNSPPAITEWGEAPSYFNDVERECWERLGRSLVAAGTVSVADTLIVEIAAREMARLHRLYADEKATPATVSAVARICKELLIQLGLTPQARKHVGPMGSGPASADLTGLLE